MRRKLCMLHAGVWAAIAVLLCCGRAYAYLDPGTGSYVLQIVIAAAAGAAFTLKLFWRRIKLHIGGVVSKRKGRREERPPDEKA